MKKRLELALPLIQTEPANELPPEVQRAYQDASVDAALDALGVGLPLGLPAAFLTNDDADPLVSLLRRYARTHGPFVAADPARRFGLAEPPVVEALRRLGLTQQQLKSYDAARESFTRAHAIVAAAGQLSAAGQLLDDLGFLSWTIGDGAGIGVPPSSRANFKIFSRGMVPSATPKQYHGHPRSFGFEAQAKGMCSAGGGA